MNEPAAPLTLIVTRRCNLECVYCPVGKRDADLDPLRARQVVGDHIGRGGNAVRLTGGEPALAWPTVRAVLEEVDSRGRGEVSVELCTSGVELGRDQLRELDRPWIRVVVSVDGHPATQRASGRPWPRLLPDLLALPRTAVTLTVAPRHAHHLLDGVLHLWNLGARRFNVLPVYWTRWQAGQLRHLAENLAGAAEWLRPHVRRGEADLLNLRRHGSVPLFNDHPTVDADGTFHQGNLVLADRLFQGRLAPGVQSPADLPGLDPDRRERAEAAVTSAVRRSNRQVDAALDHFVQQFHQGGDRPTTLEVTPSDRPDRLEIHVAYDCDNRCDFCSEAHRLDRWRDHPVSAMEIRRALVSHARAGGSHVNLTGGEPSGHPAFLYALQLARGLGLRTYVGTNGSRLSDPVMARHALPLLDELSLSLHGSTAAVHDRATGRRGSFDRILAARGNALHHEHLTLFVNTVVTRANFDDLPDVMDLCGRLGVPSLLLSNVAPEGRALDSYADLAVPLAGWKERAPWFARRARELSMRLRFFGLPLCALGPARMKSNDLHYDPRVTVERARGAHGSVRMSHVATHKPRRGRRYTPRCRGCAYRALCGGVFAAYVEHFGDGGLEAIRG